MSTAISIVKELMGKNYDAFREDHINEIAEAKVKDILESQWVSVEDKLPEPDATRMIDGRKHSIYYLTDGEYGPTVALYRYHELSGYWWDDGAEGVEGVTRYQLITPPK